MSVLSILLQGMIVTRAIISNFDSYLVAKFINWPGHLSLVIAIISVDRLDHTLYSLKHPMDRILYHILS